MYKYLEIIDMDTDAVIRRMDVSNKTETQIERIDNGLNINLNHDKYLTVVKEYRVRMPVDFK